MMMKRVFLLDREAEDLGLLDACAGRFAGKVVVLAVLTCRSWGPLAIQMGLSNPSRLCLRTASSSP